MPDSSKSHPDQKKTAVTIKFSDTLADTYTMDYSHLDDEPKQGNEPAEHISRTLEIAVRSIGILLLGIGLVLGFLVLKEAWQLYNQPERIERFVLAIEQGSHLDQILAPVADSRGSEGAENLLSPLQPDARADNGNTHSSAPVPAGIKDFRLAYFPAWFIVILLLLLIGHLALAAVRTGGELALFNLLSRRAVKSLLKEIRR